MPIEKQSYLHEVRIRGNAAGLFETAEQIHVERVVDTDTGQVLVEKLLPPTPLNVADIPILLGESFAGLAAQVSTFESTQLAMEDQLMRAHVREQELIAQLAAVGAAPPSKGPAVTIISDRQFAQGLVGLNMITRDEALAFVQKGVLPSLLANYVTTIWDDSTRFGVEMLLTGAKEFDRNHPLVGVMGQEFGFDAAGLDAFWIQCASL